MILSFKKLKKVTPTEEHNRNYSSDCGVPGTYVPNMSGEDRVRWKAKLVGQRSKNYQIEIRTEEPGANLLVIVNGESRVHSFPRSSRAGQKPHEVRISTNGPLTFPPELWGKLNQAVFEARAVLAHLDNPETRQEALGALRVGDFPPNAYLEAILRHRKGQTTP